MAYVSHEITRTFEVLRDRWRGKLLSSNWQIVEGEAASKNTVRFTKTREMRNSGEFLYKFRSKWGKPVKNVALGVGEKSVLVTRVPNCSRVCRHALLWVNLDLQELDAAKPGVRGRSPLIQLQTQLTVYNSKNILHMKHWTIKRGRIKILTQVSSFSVFMNRTQ